MVLDSCATIYIGPPLTACWVITFNTAKLQNKSPESKYEA